MSTFLELECIPRYKRLWQNWISILPIRFYRWAANKKPTQSFTQYNWCCCLRSVSFSFSSCSYHLLWDNLHEMTRNRFVVCIRTIYGFMAGLKEIYIKLWFTVSERAWDAVRSIDAHTNWNRRLTNQITLICMHTISAILYKCNMEVTLHFMNCSQHVAVFFRNIFLSWKILKKIIKTNVSHTMHCTECCQKRSN